VGILVIREFASRAKIIGSIASFIGALIVVYPDIATLDENFVPLILGNKTIGEFNVYYLFVFFSIIVWSLNCTVIKFLGKTESSKVQMFYGLLFQLVIAFPLAFFNWGNVSIGELVHLPLPVALVDMNVHNLNIQHYLLFVLLAFCYFVHSITFFLSFKHGEMSVVVPFDYSRLIFTALLAFWILGEAPEIGSYVGYFLIAASGVYIAISEAKRKKAISEKKIKQLEEELEHA
jgi:S-adenosylmethionine uptake transporter